MNIGFDLDDVISNTYPVILEEALKYHRNILKRDFKKIIEENSKGDYCYFAKVLGWNSQEYTDFYHIAYPYFLENCFPKKNVKSVIDTLVQKGHYIYIITARELRDYADVYRLTQDWLSRWKIHADCITIEAKEKQKYVKEYGIKIFIDDSYSVCKKVSKSCDCKVYHHICNYNRLGKYEYNENVNPLIDISKLKDELIIR